MDNIMNDISELERQIAMLPVGSIATKTVSGKIYYYRRWTENGKKREVYIPAQEEPEIRKQIEERKILEAQLKTLKAQLPHITKPKNMQFQTDVRTGNTLYSFSSTVKGYKKRACYEKLYNYVYGDRTDKVFILYGLRRTGKTTMIRQIISEMTPSDIGKTAFMQISQKDSLATVKHDLRLLEQSGYKYIFIDEVTLLEDFIEGAAVFSDIFASCGMKIVLSGTDSLGFILSEDEALYDRCELLHTTFIPYREFEEVLGIAGIDEYIRYGGTMSLGGINYNEKSTFASKKSADNYVDSAIARNIQHSLKYYRDGGHFRSLYELYEKNELTNAINRVVEDINHRFTIEVMTKVFKSNDLAISARNLRRDDSIGDILDKLDVAEVTDRLKRYLEIKDVPERKVEITDTHIGEIKEYLELLDLIAKIDVENKGEFWEHDHRIAFTQPGLRYAQAKALIQSIMADREFQKLSLDERTVVTERILNEIKGRMTEDIILLETAFANPKQQIFKCFFAVGEFDMVIANTEKLTCEIYEIKHSEVIVPEQYRHLTDTEKCDAVTFRFGPIKGKYVLYRGEDTEVNGIHYRNIEGYLKSLKTAYNDRL